LASNGFEVLRDAYLSWAQLAREQYQAGVEAARDTPPAYACVDEVIACGMGGSGIVGDYLAKLSDAYGGVPVSTIRSTVPPRRAGRRTLVLGVSFSGKTVETIRCVESAADAGSLVAVVSGAGPLYERAEARGWPAVRVPQGPAARSMFAALLYAAIGFLKGLGLLSIPYAEIESSFTALADAGVEDEAIRVASSLKDASLVLVVTGWELAPLSLRAVQEFAENSKKPGIPVYAPEALHNFIEGLDRLSTIGGVRALVIDWNGYSARPLFEHLAARVSERVGATRLEVRRAGVIHALAWATLVVGLASIHVARLEGVNPLETPFIKEARSVAERM